MAARKVTVCGI